MHEEASEKRSWWPGALVGAAVLAFSGGLACGVAAGLWRHLPLIRNGFPLPALDEANRIALLAGGGIAGFLALFLGFLALLRRGATTGAVLRASALAALPFVLVLGRRIDLDHGITQARLFAPRALAFNLKLGLGFVAAWALVAASLVAWTRRRLPVPGPGSRPSRGLPALAVLALGVLGLRAAAAAPRWLGERRTDALVIVIDCLRADHLGCYGYERDTSPHLDALAGDGVRFANPISQSTYTKTSIASLFTSKSAHRHGVYRGSNRDAAGMVVSDVLPHEERTLAEVLLDAGYVTTAWLDQGQIRAYMGFDQGFLVYDNGKASADRIHAEYLDWDERYGDRTDSFTYLHTIDLHDPYSPKPPYDTMFGHYSDVYEGLDIGHSLSWGDFHVQVRRGERVLSAEDVQQLEASYDGLIRQIDDSIGRMLDELKARGRYDDALIVVTADHGDGFMEHGFLAHSAAPYEELVRVPLLVKLPGNAHAGEVVDEQVRLIDVAPTILDVLGVPPDPAMEGRSLLACLGADASAPPPGARFAYSEITEDLSPHGIAVRTDRWKYVWFPDEDRAALYDLSSDPGEREDVSAAHPEEAAELRRLVEAAYAEGRARAVGEVRVDEGSVEELRKLGYLR